MRALYHNAFIPYAVYGLISYSFIYSYADAFIPFLFGSKYTDTSFFCKEMFLTMIIFPTTFLQANVLITMKLEKLDMLCNVVSLVLNILFCIVGFIYFQKSLSVVNYAIFFSFTAFHIIQDVVLIKKGITSLMHVLLFYGGCAAIVFFYQSLVNNFRNDYLFFIFWSLFGLVALFIFFLFKRKQIPFFAQNKPG